MFRLVTLATLIVSAFSRDIYDDVYMGSFQGFMQHHNKTYGSENELRARFDIFVENVKFVHEMNTRNHSFRLDLNQFADLTVTEFNKMHKGYNEHRILRKTTSCQAFDSKINESDLPSSFDWREKGAVTSVKNQGQCGSCWSFSSAGAMEGTWYINNGELEDFSEQQLIDCSKLYGNFGCNGGLMDNAFEYAIDNGMCLDADAPYEAQTGTCSDVSSCEKVAFFDHCVDVTPDNQVHLQEAVTTYPVSIAIEADTRVFQFYTSGIITSEGCGTTLDHGVLLVGYGEEAGTMYWTVKNSWGESWGEDGYVRIERSTSQDDVGICGVASTPSYIV